MQRRARRRRRLYPLGAFLAVVVFLIIRGLGGSGSSSGSSDPEPKVLVSRLAPKQLPAPISGETAVILHGGTLIIGGLDAGEASVRGVFRLDRTGKLRPAGSLSGPLHDAAATALGDKVLVLGGGTATSTDTVQALPVSAATGQSATASIIGHLPAVRSDLSAVTIGDKAYVLGGYDGTIPDPAVLATADGRSFEQVAELRVPARYLATAVVGERIYAFGGETASGAATDAIQEVDPDRGTARVIGHLPRPVSHAAAVVLGGRVYVLGGEDNGTATNRVWQFDPATGKVAAAPSLPLAVSGGAAVSAGRTAYLLGGTGTGGEALASIVLLRLQARLRTARG